MKIKSKLLIPNFCCKQGLSLMVVACLFFVSLAGAQEARGPDSENQDDQDIDQIEAEMKKAQIPRREKKEETTTSGQKPQTIENVTELSRLAPAADVVVIEKRYMPKTGRFQFFGGLSNLANDPWFSGWGLQTRLGYGLTEAWGIELQGLFLSTSSRDSVKDLSSAVAVNTNSLVSSKNYMGAQIVWTPFYGKLSLWDSSIIPFDMLFTLGGGATGLSSSDVSSASTIHAGVGQIFAVTKSFGVRWSLDVHSFTVPSGRYNNVFLNLGVSYFIPDVGPR